jgi:hypothetical protein
MYNTETATITPNGIAFKTRTYTCRRAIKEQWFGCSTHYERTIPVLNRPEDISTIIIGNIEDGDICRQVAITPFDGKRLAEYQEALDCFKIARNKYRKKGPKSRSREKWL